MTMATYRCLLDSLRTIRTVRSVAYWGIGEPLMHPHIVEMLRSAHDLGLQTELITNAQLLDETLATGLVDAGLDRIVISLDGTTQEGLAANRLGSDLGRIRENVNGLRRARRARGARTPEIAVEFVLMRSNLGQLRDLPRTARELGARTVYVSNVLPYSREFATEILYFLAAASDALAIRFEQTNGFVVARLDDKPEIVEAVRALPVRASRDSLLPPLLTSRYGSKCPFLERGALAVRADGAVSPCVELLHSHTVYVLEREKRVRPYVVGTLEHETLPEIWQREEYRKFRERVQEFDFPPCVGCGGCEWVHSNEEDCFGSPFPTCGDCLWARGVILCP
jgi:MoaA/NifB/PqqE/SkfB family radical SAM enzyme